MKKQDLPQDESNLKSANMTEVVYVTDENDNYTTANSIGWEAKKLALDESMALINERIEEARQNVADQIASPIIYFMELNKMDLSVLSAYVGIWQWRVKRHTKPKVFKTLSDTVLKKYADAFEITVSELKNFDGK
ncbi:helix-turn-helix domain-containing protein [Chryseobacterium paludis]|uniref:helix-turn-helix domain-containing protein n=1 Tax=Chryseobacterium paludis TaxID=2956784 RepID=UPI0021C0094A|nr:helix-turn-helix domain-containing protein [Chryseobacterium paludis]